MRSRLLALTLAFPVLLGTAVSTPATATERVEIEHQVIHSFDGVPLYSTLFLPPEASDETPVPLVMRTHGWAAPVRPSSATGP